MSITEDVAALIAERPDLSIFIDRIEATEHGCKYLFDGIMNCHVVFDRGRYADVQDVYDTWKPWEETGHGVDVWTRYDSVLSLVLNMEKVLTP